MFKRFPSVDIIVKESYSSFLRFPFAVIFAAANSIMYIKKTHDDSLFSNNLDYEHNLLFIFYLGVPFFIALTLLSERYQWKTITTLISKFLLVCILGLYFYSLPVDFIESVFIVRYFILLLLAHFLVSIVSFFGSNKIDNFWQFNKTLFLNFLFTTLYSLVIALGLILAFSAIKLLFNVDISYKMNAYIFTVSMLLIHVWIFLSKLPRDYNSEDYKISYPTALKGFTQYILLPLSVIYFVILIAYEFKIILEWNLPKGWVSYLILSYSIVGILSILLLYPIRKSEENRWINNYSKWFFRLMIPFIVMLFVAIMTRINEYGVTELRYLVFALAIGLTIVTLYFIFSKQKDIRAIPLVLSIIAIISIYGPWSAFSVSFNSQKSRLINMLEENNLLVNNTIVASNEKLSFEQNKEMSELVYHLQDNYGTESFLPWMNQIVEDMPDILSIRRDSVPKQIANLLGFELVDKYVQDPNRPYFYRAYNERTFQDIRRYDYWIKVNISFLLDSVQHSKMSVNDTLSLEYNLDYKSAVFTISQIDSLNNSILLSEINLNDYRSIMLDTVTYNNKSLKELNIDFSSEYLDAMMIVESIQFNLKNDSIFLDHFNADLYVDIKEDQLDQ